ncbi:MAG TPA: potassium/proton antiporter [Solirubrobacteraceae bacterium]|nr:potassium/proton antiporter [Solirubrobacteraceae bacterium]
MTGAGEILLTGALLTAALAASLLAGRLRLPGLVVLLGLGMALGSEGLGGIDFGDYDAAQRAGIVALALILFEGGLAAGFGEIRPVLRPAVSLALVGTLATALATGAAAAWLFDFSLPEGMLLGSIVSATDGAAIFSLLRGSALRRRLTRTLEGEAGFNDPVAVLLVLGFIDWIRHPGYGVADMTALFARELGIGLAIGVLVGFAALYALQRIRLPSAGLYPVASLAAAGLAYGGAAEAHGSGFLAVYLAGLVIGSRQSPALRTITTFHDGLAWISQLGMFLMLGLLVFPDQLGSVALEASLLALILVFLARPLAALLATVGARYSIAERVTLGWAGLRGAAPIVLATFPVLAHTPHSHEFFNIVFFAVLLSTVLQGVSFGWVAERLGVTSDERALPAPLIHAPAMRRLGAEVAEFEVRPADAAAGRLVRELGLPRDALLNVIIRGEQAIPPRGSTRIEPGDRLHVLVRQEAAVEFQTLLRRWREGPLGATARRRPRPRGATVFSSRPWRADDGDAGRPLTVNGLGVIEQLRTRRDVPGALVALADGRFAYTGPTVAVGSAAQLQDAARRRLHSARNDAEAAWWRDVIGALALG